MAVHLHLKNNIGLYTILGPPVQHDFVADWVGRFTVQDECNTPDFQESFLTSYISQ